MLKLNEVLKASKGLYVDDSFAMLWGKQLGGWTVSTITGTLPITFRSNGTALINYRIYGTADGAGVQTGNLFDANNATCIEDNVYINVNTGDKVSNLTYYVSAPIPVASEEKYFWVFSLNSKTSHSVPTVGFFDENDNQIGVASHTAGIKYFSFTTPTNCAYVKASVYKPDINDAMLVKSSTPPETYIPYGYKLPLTLTSGTESKDTDIYIGDNKLLSGDYVDYESGKIVRNGTPQDPPLTLPELEAFEGANTLDSTETLGQVTITGKIKEV